jgi:hypothetical protein
LDKEIYGSIIVALADRGGIGVVMLSGSCRVAGTV